MFVGIGVRVLVGVRVGVQPVNIQNEVGVAVDLGLRVGVFVGVGALVVIVISMPVESK